MSRISTPDPCCILNDNWSFVDGTEDCSYYINSPTDVSIKNGQTQVTQITTHSDSIEVLPQYSIIGGADKELFSIDQATGTLSFSTAPDVNNPTDRNRDNIYRVQIQSVGAAIDFQTIAIEVKADTNALVPITMYLLN
jgi:hypothetical protein